MKKFILILLMTFTLTSFFAINIFAINVDYTFNITDNKKWNLETGSIENDLKFAVTSKMIIKDDRIITSSETYHHVVFWNSKNQFIGYKNSQYSILENDYFLGNIEYGSAGFDAPANAHFFSFMIYKSGNSINYTELGNQSLSDIFDLYNSSNLEDKDNNILDGYSLDELYNTQLSGKNLFDGMVELGFIDTSGNNGTFGSGSRSTNFTNVNASTSYTISYDYYASTPSVIYIFEYDASYNFILRTQTTNPESNNRIYGTITTQSNTAYLRFRTDTNFSGLFENAQIEKGSTATDFEPYANSLTREYFKDYEQIANTNYTELDNGRLRYVVNQDTISSNSQPLYELNGLSLDDVFNTGNVLQNHDFSNGSTGWTLSNASVVNQQGYIDNTINTSNSYLLQYGFNTTDTYYVYAEHNVIQGTIWYATSGAINYTTSSNTYHSRKGTFSATYFVVGRYTANTQAYVDNIYAVNMSSLSITGLTENQMFNYLQIYLYFLNGGTDPQTFTYDSPIYYDITYRLDEQFNGLDITAQEFIDNQDGYNRIINNEQANDFILYYAAQYAQDNNISLGLSIQQWEQYYLNYLTFDDANSPFIASLNYNSLNDVFLDGNNFNLSLNIVQTSNATYNIQNNILEIIGNQTATSAFVRYLASNVLINNKIYLNYIVKCSSNSTFFVYDGYTVNTFASNPTDWTQVSGFDPTWQTTQSLYLQFNAGDVNNISCYFDLSSFYVIDTTTLGIDNLTQAQMDAYYDDYIDNQTLEQNLYLQALTPTSFDLIDPNYDYTAPPPDDFLDVDSDTFLDNLLTNIGFNNDLGKVTLSILILFLTTLTLIKFNLGTSVILGVDILVYVGLTFLGWLPAWINILIALIIMVLFYLRFKGGGSNNEESD